MAFLPTNATFPCRSSGRPNKMDSDSPQPQATACAAARQMIVEEMKDGMIFLDTQGRIADLNPAAEKLIGRPAASLIGQGAAEALAGWPGLSGDFLTAPEALHEISIETNGTPEWYEMRIAPLHDKQKRLLGHVITLRDITAHKRASEQLGLQTTALASAANAIVLTDTKGFIQWVNPAFTTLTGYTPEEVLGKSSSLLKSGRHSAAFYQTMWNTILAGKVWQGQVTNRRKDGRIYYEEQTITPVRNERGEIFRFIAIKQDVTVRKQVEERVDQLLREQQIILDTIPAVVAFQKNQGIVWANQMLFTMLGYAVEELRGVQSLIYPAEENAQERFAAIMEAQLSSEGAAAMEAQLQHKNGTHLWGNIVGQTINARNPEDGVLWVIQDISAKRQADEQLRQLSRAVESSPTSIIITNTQGEIEYINPKFTQVTGYTPEEVLGRNPRILKTDQTPARVHRELWESLHAGLEWRGEFCNRKKNGELYWESASISPIKDADGVITHYVAVKEDITQRKEAEEALALARDQALEASRLKSQLLAKVSHELRTPLGGILGYAELLHHGAFGPLAAQQQNITAQIIENTNYLSYMVNELLDEAQIEAQTLALRMGWFSPHAVLKKVETSMDVLAKHKGLALIAQAEADLPEALFGDERRLQQILINLVGNAIKYTQQGEVRITLSRRDANHWMMQVSDTGNGIPEEAQNYIFEPFRQVDNAITRENPGAGLGLSITKQLVDLMNGQISLKSTVGQGSIFTILLPIVKPSENKP